MNQREALLLCLELYTGIRQQRLSDLEHGKPGTADEWQLLAQALNVPEQDAQLLAEPIPTPLKWLKERARSWRRCGPLRSATAGRRRTVRSR
jgi:hypothetical protein